MKICVVAILMAFSLNAFAVSQDSGKIAKLYVDESGNIAVILDMGFPNAVQDGQCVTGNGFAGTTTAAVELKSVLLAAKASGANVIIDTLGCDAGGAWLKVKAIYVE